MAARGEVSLLVSYMYLHCSQWRSDTLREGDIFRPAEGRRLSCIRTDIGVSVNCANLSVTLCRKSQCALSVDCNQNVDKYNCNRKKCFKNLRV